MVLGHADTQGWRNHDILAPSDLMRDQFGTQGIGSDKSGGSVLFGRTNGNNDPGRLFQIILNFRPCTQLQAHALAFQISVAGLGCCTLTPFQGSDQKTCGAVDAYDAGARTKLQRQTLPHDTYKILL